MKQETTYALMKVAFLYTLALTVDCFVRDQAFTASLEWAKRIQKDYEISWLMKYGNSLLSQEVDMVVLLISLQFMDLQHTFIQFGAQGFANIVISLLKQVIRAPRPFFEDTKIKADGACKYVEFGSPSGHAFAGAVIYANLTLLMLKYYKCSMFTRIMSFFLILMPVIELLCASRVY